MRQSAAQVSVSGYDPSRGKSRTQKGLFRLSSGLYQRGDGAESGSDGELSREGSKCRLQERTDLGHNKLCHSEPRGPLLEEGMDACLVGEAVEIKVNNTGEALGMGPARINMRDSRSSLTINAT